MTDQDGVKPSPLSGFVVCGALLAPPQAELDATIRIPQACNAAFAARFCPGELEPVKQAPTPGTPAWARAPHSGPNPAATGGPTCWPMETELHQAASGTPTDTV